MGLNDQGVNLTHLFVASGDCCEYGNEHAGSQNAGNT
jgi:hypothetical protein